MCSALQDPASWGDVASFNMSEVASPPKHFSSLQQERTGDSSTDKNCAPFVLGGVTSLTPISSSKPTQISVWRRRRKDRGETSPLCDRTGTPFMENLSNSPKKTPTKSLPFTPLRVNAAFFIHVLLLLHSFLLFDHVANLPSLCICSDLQHIRD